MAVSRDELRAILRLPRAPERVDVEVVERVEVPGGHRSLVRYPGVAEPVPAFLLEPARGHGGAVVVQHQHASRWHEGKSEVAGLVGDPLHAFGPALLQRGWVVLAPDAPAFEDRRPGGPGTDVRDDDWRQYHNAAHHRLVRGQWLVTEAVGDLEIAVSAVRGRPGVERVGFLGHSHGGNLGQWLTAADPRVAFACVSGSCGSYRGKLASGTGLEYSLVVPGIADQLDVEDLIRLVRPRPLLVVAGLDDPYARDAVDVVSRANPWDGLELVSVPGGHALDAERVRTILAWFDRR